MTTPTVTRQKLKDVMIVADPRRNTERPTLCMVVWPCPGGREVLADELEDRRAAERWIEAQRTMAPEGSEDPGP
jgi:hypothetical protein